VTRAAALLAVALLLAGIAAAPADAGGDAVPQLLSALGKKGWTQAGATRRFSPETLYEEIDGEAELYLPYDFRELSVVILESAARPGVELRVELFRHGGPKEAFGIFSQYRYQDQETARVGPATAALSDASLDFFRGDAFVRMRVASGALSREALLSAGEAAVAAMPGTAEPPPGASVVAIPSAIPGTLIYQRKAMLGFEPLAPGFEARFVDGQLAGRAIFIEGDGAATRLRDRLAKGMPGFRAVGEGEWSAALPQGTLHLKAVAQGAVGVVGKMTRGQAGPILEALSRNAGEIAKGSAPRGGD
jgi:hypothetical protein